MKLFNNIYKSCREKSNIKQQLRNTIESYSDFNINDELVKSFQSILNTVLIEFKVYLTKDQIIKCIKEAYDNVKKNIEIVD